MTLYYSIRKFSRRQTVKILSSGKQKPCANIEIEDRRIKGIEIALSDTVRAEEEVSRMKRQVNEERGR